MTDFTNFTSAHEALKWLYRFDPEQVAAPPMNRLASTPSFGGRGLGGYDGATMAGWIRSEVSRLPRHQQILLAAQFAPSTRECRCKRPCCSGHSPNPEWTAAITALTDQVMSVLAGTVVSYRLRRGMVEKIFGRDVSLEDLAAQAGVSRPTASSQHAKLVVHLKGARGGKGRDGRVGEIQRAEAAIDERLRACGIVRDDT